jgi:peptidyl-prolyl cis-trans isomerase SurA
VFLNSNFRSYDKSKNIEDFLNKQYSVFLDQSLFNYKKDNLINENQDYANVLKEYEEGLLLFDIMEEKIWNGAKSDTIGLKKYYNSNLDSYKSKFDILATIINSPSKKLLKEVLRELDNGISSDSIIKKYTKKNLIINTGKFNLDDPLLPQNPKFKKNINKRKIYKLQTGYVIVNIDEVIPSKILSFDEVKGSVIADFQTVLESKWIDKLRFKYNLIVYNDVLDELKRFLN